MDYIVAASGLLAVSSVGFLLLRCKAAFDEDAKRVSNP